MAVDRNNSRPGMPEAVHQTDHPDPCEPLLYAVQAAVGEVSTVRLYGPSDKGAHAGSTLTAQWCPC